MAMLTSDAIEGYKRYTEDMIDYAKYKIDNKWYDATIHRKERMKNGRVAVYFSITPQHKGAIKIAGVQLIDVYGRKWAEKTENITIESVQEGVLYRFTFDIREQEVSK